MYRKIHTVAAVAALMLAGGAFADDTQRGMPGVDVDVNANVKMPMVDKNSDGKVTRSEAASNPELSRQFDTLDKNKDGSLDKGEFAKFQAKGHGDGKGAIGNDTGDEAPNKNNTPGTTDDSTPGNKDKLGPGR
jgi:hypothetical protein